jgi:hypothetical protein
LQGACSPAFASMVPQPRREQAAHDEARRQDHHARLPVATRSDASAAASACGAQVR